MKLVIVWVRAGKNRVKKVRSLVTILVTAAFFLGGCTSYEVGRRNPNALEKEGMGLVRTITSPINVFGPTYATYDHLYNESEIHVVKKVLVTPFVPLLTIPSGTFAMTTDVMTGPIEMLTFSHFSNVAYPWETYEYHVARIWNEVTPVLLVSLATAGAGAAAAADAMNGHGSSSTTSYNSNYNTGQSYQSTSNVSVDPSAETTAQNRAALDAKIGYLQSKIDRQRQSVANVESMLDKSARSGSSTIALSRTVNSERAILRNYESQLSQLQSQRAGM